MVPAKSGVSRATLQVLRRVRDTYHPLHHIRRNPVARAAISRLDIPIWARIYGVRWPVRLRLLRDIAYIVNRRTHEPEVFALFIAISSLYGPRCFWDVGAGIGLYSWLLKSLDPDVEVAMFEPDPVSNALIRETLRRGALDRVSLIGAAVSDRSGRATFTRDEVTGATGSLNPPEQGYNRVHFSLRGPQLSVDTVSLDDIRARQTAPVDLLKIDVEGHEEAVFRGAVETLSRDLPTVVFESFAEHPRIRDDLLRLGYEILDAEQMTPNITHASNFLAVPPQRRDTVAALVQKWQQTRAEIGL